MKNVVVWIGAGCACAGLVALTLRRPAQAEPPSGLAPRIASPVGEDANHQKWLLNALTKAESLRPGMTRREVNAAFTPTPGQMTSPGLTGCDARRTFALKDCPLVKVEFEFLPASFGAPKYRYLQDRSAMWAGRTERSDDVIVGMSPPVLAR